MRVSDVPCRSTGVKNSAAAVGKEALLNDRGLCRPHVLHGPREARGRDIPSGPGLGVLAAHSLR